MAVLLFNLKNVPDDEATEVRDVLSQHHIDYYETPPGKWGISVGAIWLNDKSQLDYAKQLIDTYQQERRHRVKQAFEKLQQAGEVESMLDRLKQRPLQFIAYLMIISLVIYLSLTPFLHLGD